MKSNQTLLIENLLRGGLHSMRAIARSFGISAARVGQINKKMRNPQPRPEVRELWRVDEVLRSQREQLTPWVVI